MKIIIAGTRTFNDYELLKKICDETIYKYCPIEIVSGRCSTGILTFTTDDEVDVYGADGLGERYAKEMGHKVTPFKADWKKYGKSAGPIRNSQMAIYAYGCIVFWDGKSRGGLNMIQTAKDHKLKLRIVQYE